MTASPFQVARRNEQRARQEVDEPHRCAWHAESERCGYPGSMSRSTLGGGPWYCSAHFVCSDAATGAQIVDESRGFRAGDAIVAAPRPTVVDGTCEVVQEEPGSGG